MRYWLSYIDALIQTGQTDLAKQMLEQGRQRGLRGVAVEALAGRMEENVQDAVQSKAESLHALNALQNSKEIPNAKLENTIKKIAAPKEQLKGSGSN